MGFSEPDCPADERGMIQIKAISRRSCDNRRDAVPRADPDRGSPYARPSLFEWGATNMRPLRWKSRYATGNAEVDRRNRGFVDCFNSLIEAAGRREHCREMEELIGRFSVEAEQRLRDRPAEGDLGAELGRWLMNALPLGAYGSTACRQCGLCDMARQKVADHLKAPAECLFK
jgi:hypothetical protein